jgi:hypothetical protein
MFLLEREFGVKVRWTETASRDTAENASPVGARCSRPTASPASRWSPRLAHAACAELLIGLVSILRPRLLRRL